MEESFEILFFLLCKIITEEHYSKEKQFGVFQIQIFIVLSILLTKWLSILEYFMEEVFFRVLPF